MWVALIYALAIGVVAGAAGRNVGTFKLRSGITPPTVAGGTITATDRQTGQTPVPPVGAVVGVPVGVVVGALTQIQTVAGAVRL